MKNLKQRKYRRRRSNPNFAVGLLIRNAPLLKVFGAYIIVMILSMYYSPWEHYTVDDMAEILSADHSSGPVLMSMRIISYGINDILQFIVYSVECMEKTKNESLWSISILLCLIFSSLSKYTTEFVVERKIKTRSSLENIAIDFMLDNVIFYFCILFIYFVIPAIYVPIPESLLQNQIIYAIVCLLLQLLVVSSMSAYMSLPSCSGLAGCLGEW